LKLPKFQTCQQAYAAGLGSDSPYWQ